MWNLKKIDGARPAFFRILCASYSTFVFTLDYTPQKGFGQSFKNQQHFQKTRFSKNVALQLRQCQSQRNIFWRISDQKTAWNSLRHRIFENISKINYIFEKSISCKKVALRLRSQMAKSTKHEEFWRICDQHLECWSHGTQMENAVSSGIFDIFWKTRRIFIQTISQKSSKKLTQTHNWQKHGNANFCQLWHWQFKCQMPYIEFNSHKFPHHEFLHKLPLQRRVARKYQKAAQWSCWTELFFSSDVCKISILSENFEQCAVAKMSTFESKVDK